MKNKTIYDSIENVSQRNRTQRFREYLCNGLFSASIMVVTVILLRLFGLGFAASPWLILGVVLPLFALIFGIVGYFLPLEQHESAKKIDSHYSFKDRLSTALNLLKLGTGRENTTMERLQIADAVEHAKKVDPVAVLPFRMPRSIFRAFCTLVVAVLLCAASSWIDHNKIIEAALPIDELISINDQLHEELLEPVKELAEDNPEEQPIQKLPEKIEELLKKLQENNTDPKESLLTLSQMEAVLNAAKEEFQLEAMDDSLADLADALSAAEATRSASQAMKDGNFAKASQELKNANTEDMSKQERKAVSDKLKSLIPTMQKRNQEKLAKISEKLAKELEEGNCDGAKESNCEIAGICDKHGLRKGICQGLDSKLALLGLCKSQCSGACQGNQDGGEAKSKSNSPSNNWGKGTAGDPQSGPETNLDSNREQKQITGMFGDGPSEFETLASDDGSDEATKRSYSEAYRDYQKMSESVLDSEPIPLGQRQMIRKYFESIRPKE